MRQLFILLLLFWASVGMAEVKLHEDIRYCTGGNQALLLDLVEPAVVKPNRPVILFVHGGGWQAGSRRDYRELMTALAEKGFVGVSVDYRLASQARFPAQLHDLKCAVRWMHAQAGRFNFNADDIVALGGSAGAHLVALLGTTNGDQAYEGNGGYTEYSSRINAMVLHGGGYDLSHAFTDSQVKPGTRHNIFALLGAKEGDNPQQYADASPINHVDKNSVDALIIHGELDELVPLVQPQKMHSALQSAGARSQLVVVKKGGHLDFGRGAEEQRVKEILLAFLARHRQ